VEKRFRKTLSSRASVVSEIATNRPLLGTDADIEPGQHIIISIDIDPRDEPVSGKAEVVRKADPNRDGVEGIGIRFLGFTGDGHLRLQAILG